RTRQRGVQKMHEFRKTMQHRSLVTGMIDATDATAALETSTGREPMPLLSTHEPIESRRTRDVSTIATQKVAPGVTARIGIGRLAAVERGRLATIVVRVLEDADEAIYRDREAAKACIARASALLRDEVDHDRMPATLVRGGLTPWQMRRVKAHVEAHLDSTIRIGDLAVLAGLSTSHFSRSFARSF